ncbi:RecX family transcriptional regulator [Candidatus Gracilibacteria bacterium]|nr:RecX family transcriptional regulator [Candidatus Gracilibacteria bacterium]
MFTPTSKQLQAIKNIEKFCNINSHRDFFESSEEFQEYFKLLSKKASKKAKLLGDVESGKITLKEINKLKKEKLQKIYADENTLKNYGLKYIEKYHPTKAKLLEKLTQKTNNKESVKNVFESLKSYIDEVKMIGYMIDDYKSKQKDINYITGKLYQKKFDKHLIIKEIEKLKNLESYLDKEKLKKQIISLKSKNKRVNYIKQTLIKREVDREIVEEVLEEIFGNDEELESIKYEVEKLKNKGFSKEKILKKMILKGFKYSDVRDMMSK